MESIYIERQDLGKFTLTVPDNRPFLWYGNYEGIKLSLHLADISGQITEPHNAFIFTVIDPNDSEIEFVGWYLTLPEMEMTLAIESVLEYVHQAHITRLMEVKCIRSRNGTLTLQ